MRSSTSIEIDWDQPCAGCRYNLRGLATDHACPECGKPIQETFLAGFLPPQPTAQDRWMLVLVTAMVCGPLLMGVVAVMFPPSYRDSIPQELLAVTYLSMVAAFPVIAIWMGVSRFARWSDLVWFWLFIAFFLACAACGMNTI
jgi:hypothetical protein